MKLDETLVGEMLTEKSANASLNAENGLFRGGTQVEDSVVQSGVSIYANESVIFGIIGAFRSGGVLDLKRKLRNGLLQFEKRLRKRKKSLYT